MKFELIENGGVCTALGFSASAVVADVKGKNKGNLDLAILVSDEPCQTAAVFTSNVVMAAPVLYNKALLDENTEFTGIVVNSGNANACTGEQGLEDCKNIVTAAEKELGLAEKSLLAASTGVIGHRLPADKMISHIPALCDGVDDDNGNLFANAIMTTDMVSKEVAVLVTTDEGTFVIGGACKGAGMISPCMATMLGFITTDAKIKASDLQIVLKEATDVSFNCITVDGDMSTNDSLFVFANGMSDVEIGENNVVLFTDALAFVCRELALKVVRDGEGATKLVTIDVRGARTNDEARLCAAKIANSPLVKTMFAGCDPNWGRLLSSAGASGADFNPESVSIHFNDLHYVANGLIIDPALEGQVREIMKTAEYKITINLMTGIGRATHYTCDLTQEYVAVNVDYRS